MGLTKKNWCKVDMCVCVCSVSCLKFSVMCVYTVMVGSLAVATGSHHAERRPRRLERRWQRKSGRGRRLGRSVWCCWLFLVVFVILSFSHSLYCSRGVCQGGWADFLKPEGQQGLEACHVSSTICVGYTEVVYWNGVFVFIVVMVHRYWWFPYFFPLSFPLHFTPLFYCGTAEIFNDPELLQLFSVSQAEQCHMTIMWLTLLCVTTVCFKHWHTYLALYILHKLCTYVCVRTIFGVVYEL